MYHQMQVGIPFVIYYVLHGSHICEYILISVPDVISILSPLFSIFPSPRYPLSLYLSHIQYILYMHINTEIKNPMLYANNVRAAMAKAGHMDVTNHAGTPTIYLYI